MQKLQQRRSDAHDAYRAAGDMLAKEGKRLLLIESLILGLVAVGAHVMLYQVFSLLGTFFTACFAYVEAK